MMIQPLLEAERALTVGLLDQAERLYRGVVEADPRNSIAVVGLARVAIERGDDRVALELGRRAMAIDPQNPAAARLVARLEEVLAGQAARSAAPGPVARPVAPGPVAPGPTSGTPSATGATTIPTAPQPTARQPAPPAPAPAAPPARQRQPTPPTPAPAASPAATTRTRRRHRSLLDRLLGRR